MEHSFAEIFNIRPEIAELVRDAQGGLQSVFERFGRIAMVNQARVLKAFGDHRVSAMHMLPSTGYGYNDISRDTLDKVLAQSLQAEDALIRPQFASGTHAIATMLYALLRPGDTLLCANGTPYDTLLGVLGDESGHPPGSLRDMGVRVIIQPLDDAGCMDFQALEKTLEKERPKVVHLQRSRGYAFHDSLSESDIRRTCQLARRIAPEMIVALDNCYGEFTQTGEPTLWSADIMAGSLIKNPGGGLAPTGGYIAGRADLIELCAGRMTTPSTGREIGSYAAMYTPFYQGLFLAPHVVAQSLKVAALAAEVFERLGYETCPKSNARRDDIVQSVKLGQKERLIAFCQGAQMGAPVDAHARPEPWDMPGYDDQVIMAAGAFIQGGSIEWSADGPIREPYTVHIQGGLTFEHGKIALMVALNHVAEKGLLTL